jgi:hypothetical protein
VCPLRAGEGAILGAFAPGDLIVLIGAHARRIYGSEARRAKRRWRASAFRDAEPDFTLEKETPAMSPSFRSLVLGLVALGGAACTQLAPEDRALIDRAASDAQRAADSAARAERSAQSANEAAQRAATDARAASERSERMFQRTQRKAAGS